MAQCIYAGVRVPADGVSLCQPRASISQKQGSAELVRRLTRPCHSAQVFAQPLFASVESLLAGRSLYLEQHPARLRLVWRSCYVLFTAGVAVAIPCAPALCG